MKPKPKLITTPTRKPTHTGAVIIKTKSEHPDLTTREIAAVAKCSHVNVIETLKRYGIERQPTEDFINHRADVFAGLQHRILKSITDEDIEKSPLGSRVLAVAQIYDKERLERGQSTDNVNVLVAGLRELQARRRGKIADNADDEKQSTV